MLYANGVPGPSQPPDLLGQLKRILIPAILLVTLVSALAFALYHWWPGDQSATQRPDPGGAPAPSSEPAAPDAIAQSLATAREHLAAGRVIAPPGQNAVQTYLEVLAREPGQLAAKQALMELVPIAAAAAESSIDRGELAEFEGQLSLLRAMGVGEARLEALQRRHDAALASLTAPAPSSELVAPPAAVEVATAAAAAPAPVESLAPTPPVAPASADSPPAGTATPSVAQDSPVAADAPTPAPATAASAVVVEPVQVVDVAPSYPVQAQRRRIEGWVELEFDIGSNGSVSGVRVLRAEPAGVFDREAIRAAQRWRFQPRTIDGAAVASKGRKTLRFRLSRNS